MKLDTGSDVNILPTKDYTSLPNRSKMYATKVKLTAYNGEDVSVTGQAILTVKHKAHSKRALFVICPAQIQPILGRQMCDDMGLVKRVLAVEQAVDKKVPDIVEEYEDLFRGLGCVPGESSSNQMQNR